MKKIFTIIFVLVSFTGIAQSTFQKIIGGGSDDEAEWIIQTSDGGYATVGYTNSFGGAYFVKLDANGNTQWTKTIAGAGGNSIVQTSDGGYAITGSTNSDVFVVKLDSNGNHQWTKTIGGAVTDVGFSIIQTSDGGYAIGGRTNSFGAGNNDVYIVKLDSTGNLLWTKTIGGNSQEIGFSIIQTSDGGYAVGGYTSSFGAGSADFYIVKLDGSGNLQWTKTVGGSATDVGRSIIQTSDGGYAICGYTGDETISIYDVYVVKLNSAGNVQWKKTIGANWTESGYAIVQNSDGSYIVCGNSDSFGGPGVMDFYLVKLDVNGNLTWTRNIGTGGINSGYCITRTSDGGYAACGSTYTPGNTDFYIIKIDGNGNSCTNSGTTGTIATYGTETSGGTTSSGGVLANAVSVIGSAVDIDTMLCSSFPTAIKDDALEKGIINLSPNPATNELRIENAELRIREIEIYNVVGEKVFSKQQTTNDKQQTIDVSQLLPGVYFVAVTDDKGNKITKRFIKM